MYNSSLLLVASLGAIGILLMLYAYFLIFERRLFLAMWFAGWAIVACNYGLDAFFPDFLRQNHLIFLLSLGSYFVANLLIFWGNLIFLKTKAWTTPFLIAGAVLFCSFLYVSAQNWPDLRMIQSTNLGVFAFSCWMGVLMIRAAKGYGRLAWFLGLLNIVWAVNTVVFSYILQMPQLAPYIVSQIILLFNAIGFVQLYFKEQKSEIRHGLEHITYLTYHDELTGLNNKPYFDQRIRELDKRSDCLPVSLLVGDMNGLKFVNDVFGHQEGDKWLKRIAHLIRQSCRQEDIIARWGGDEFAIILPNTSKETAFDIGDRIKSACKSDRDTDILLSISLGVATKADDETDLPGKLKEAEELMYETKLIEGRQARGAIARNLVELLEKRNFETQEHIDRLLSLAATFAKTLGFTREHQIQLSQAVSLHDIGKIGVFGEIVLKESALSESEWSAMKKHVEIGYRIAQASGEFAYLADIILYHHEWWNGQGYPLGLKGDEIPLLSRVISVLDAFDVMTHRQIYKPAVSREDALQELSCKAGTQFDPALVSAFAGMMAGGSLD